MGHIFVLFTVFFLLVLSAFFSGLTLGLFTLSKGHLRYKAELGDKTAEKIYNVRKDGNLLLCTLIIGNVTVNSILSVFLGSLTSGVIASFISIVLIVFFGEILPQAIFARHALKLAARFIPIVEFFIFILYPVARPLSVVLDRLLGEKIPTVYSKKELEKFIEYQGGLKESAIDNDEKKIMKGALSFSDKTAGEIMTPRSIMKAVDAFDMLTHDKIEELRESGHSRIPVFKDSPDNIVGILYMKDLVGRNLQERPAGDLARKNVILADSRKPLDDLLDDFKKTRNHLFVVTGDSGKVAGVVTIEDVIEEIIGEEIIDEFDKCEDCSGGEVNSIGKKALSKI